VATPRSGLSLREQRRLRDMKRVQRVAVDLFAERGFAAVSVEQVATAAGVSPVSIYRWFGTKERLVLWDDYDPKLLNAIGEALEGRNPLDAVREGVVRALAHVYDADRELVLARTKLIYAEPSLLAAALVDSRHLEAALREMFAGGGLGDDFAAGVLAAAAVSVLTAAVDAWQAEQGRTPLAVLVEQGFAVLGEGR
jgi:AcrR family transcriptional regulator